MQPSHLCASSCFSTRNTVPLFVCKEDGGWTCEGKTTVFAAFNCNPMFCNLRTGSSNKAIASAAVRAKRRISSAKRRSSKDGIVSPRSKPYPFVSAFRLQADIPHCNTLQNKRGLNTHPCRTPALLCFAPARVKVKHYDYDTCFISTLMNFHPPHCTLKFM